MSPFSDADRLVSNAFTHISASKLCVILVKDDPFKYYTTEFLNLPARELHNLKTFYVTIIKSEFPLPLCIFTTSHALAFLVPHFNLPSYWFFCLFSLFPTVQIGIHPPCGPLQNVNEYSWPTKCKLSKYYYPLPWFSKVLLPVFFCLLSIHLDYHCSRGCSHSLSHSCSHSVAYYWPCHCFW